MMFINSLLDVCCGYNIKRGEKHLASLILLFVASWIFQIAALPPIIGSFYVFSWGGKQGKTVP